MPSCFRTGFIQSRKRNNCSFLWGVLIMNWPTSLPGQHSCLSPRQKVFSSWNKCWTIPKNRILLLLKEPRLLEQLPEVISENTSVNKTQLQDRETTPLLSTYQPPLLQQGWIIWPCNTEQYSLVSHSSPSQPLEQKHLNESTSSIHVPPFLQGFPRQSLISATKSQQLLLKAVFTYSEEWSTFVPLGKAAQSYYCTCTCKRKAQTSVFKPGRVFGCIVSHVASQVQPEHYTYMARISRGLKTPRPAIQVLAPSFCSHVGEICGL